MIRGVEINLILQEINLVTTPQGVTIEKIFLASQRAATKDKDIARYFSKRSSKVNSVVGNPVGSEFVYSDLDKYKCDQNTVKLFSIP